MDRTGYFLFAVAAVIRKVIMIPERNWFRKLLWCLFLIWVAHVFFSSLPFYTFINTGLAAARQGGFARAEYLFDDALRESRRFPERDLRKLHAYVCTGDLLLEEQRFAEAANYYQQFLAVVAPNAVVRFEVDDVRCKLASAELGMSDIGRAQLLLRSMLAKTEPGSLLAGRIYLLQAEICMRLGQRPERMFNRAIAILRKHPSSTDLYRQCLHQYLRYLRLTGPLNLRRVIAEELQHAARSRTPPPQSCASFACAITLVLLRSPQLLLTPNVSVAEMLLTPSAARKLSFLYRSDFPKSDGEIRIGYVGAGPTNQTGLIPFLVVAEDLSTHRQFYFSYLIGLNRETADPMLVNLDVIGMKKLKS